MPHTTQEAPTGPVGSSPKTTHAVQVLERWNTWVRVRFATHGREAWVNLAETGFRSMQSEHPAFGVVAASEFGNPAQAGPRLVAPAVVDRTSSQQASGNHSSGSFSENSTPSEPRNSDAGA